MAREIEGESPGAPIRILGVNGIGYESGNVAVCAGRTLPWLQDLAGVEAWARWGAGYRDVVVLDGENRPYAVFNLTTHDLADPAAYQQLEDLLYGVAATLP